MFRLFKRKSTEEGKLHYEEKKFSFGVIVLVVMMTIFLVSLGEGALSDLQEGIPPVEYPFEAIHNTVEDRKAGEYFENTLRRYQNRKWQLESEISLNDTAEDPAKVKELEKATQLLEDAEAEYARLMGIAEEAQKPIINEYRKKNRMRQAKVFAWEILFWLPFFLVTLSWHTRMKRKESKWEAVSLSAFIAASILALQSSIILLWSWIPHEILERIWEILRATILTRIVGYYIIIAVAIFVFGWIIVLVHKRMSNPLHGGKKKIRQGLCPTCSYPLNLSSVFCGGCSKALMNKCRSCKKDGYTWQSICVHCGKND